MKTPEGDFIGGCSVNMITYKERRPKPFSSYERYEGFPSDWECDYGLYANWLLRNGASFDVIEIGRGLWNRFVIEHNVKPTRVVGETK